MRVRLLRDARIVHKAGEIVEVSSAEFQFLVSVGSAVAVEVAVNPLVEAEVAEKPVKTVRKRTEKK